LFENLSQRRDDTTIHKNIGAVAASREIRRASELGVSLYYCMALLTLKHKQNAPGDFFVDTTCIDCDLCRQIAPRTFSDVGDQSIVYQQPSTPDDEFDALKALVTCPTASIGVSGKHDPKIALAAYPDLIADGVYFCGFAAESSFGASSYLITRPQGNVLVDSPRFNRPLADRIADLGGVRYMFLTHRDDIADHEQWSRHFHAERIIHKDDAGRLGSKVERLISDRDAVSLEKDLLVIPTPGHTRGHMVLLYHERFLFTGDHLWWSDNYHSLHASRGVCWYSWPEQTASMKRLLEYSFEWVLPGHGRRAHASCDQMRKYLQECIARMES